MLEAPRNSLLSLVFPQACFICGDLVASSAEGVSCLKCWSGTRFFVGSELLCSRCGALLGERTAGSPVNCRACDHHLYDSATALGVYEKGLAAAIIHLKSAPVLPRFLDLIITERLKAASLSYDVLVPVPLSRQRMLERGHNQAETIARRISRLVNAAVDTGSLVRTTNTPIHRIGMDQKAREATVAKAFEVTRPKLITGKRVLLIDDVMTSGSTSSACANVLKKAGAKEVHVLTLARAVYH
jgi:ComF family protein